MTSVKLVDVGLGLPVQAILMTESSDILHLSAYLKGCVVIDNRQMTDGGTLHGSSLPFGRQK